VICIEACLLGRLRLSGHAVRHSIRLRECRERGGCIVGPVDCPRLEHVRVNVSDFNRAVAWYESVFELAAEGHWPPEEPKYAHFPTGAAQFAISESDPVPAAGRYNFSVRDVDGWWEKLRGRADVVEPLFDTPYGTRKFTVKDPDGNELGFVRDD
jgi:predicted enzyme related to lactoylglutathione lyase